MKDITELLMRIITVKPNMLNQCVILSKKRSLRFFDYKTNGLETEIEEHKKLIEVYKNYLKDISETAYTRMKLIPSMRRLMGTKSSTIQSGLKKISEKQA